MLALKPLVHPQERNLGMSHQDTGHHATNLQSLKAVFKLVLPAELDELVRHGNAIATPRFLSAMAIICWGWTRPDSLDVRMATANLVGKQLMGQQQTISRQGLMKALATCGDQLIRSIVGHLSSQFSQWKGCWTKAGKVNVVVDGTKFHAPRTRANQQAFAANAHHKNRKYRNKADQSKANTVQLLATVFWHLGTGMPLCWKVDKKTGSERKDAAAMLEQLPSNARLIGDAEYVGYPLWSQIIESKRSFLFRVGANVTLLKNLGRLKFKDGFVYFWPDSAVSRKQPPIILRFIKLNSGKKMIYLVTNELTLSDQDAGEIYRQRWEIETYFRSIKQACGRSKLRCGTPQNALTELNWTLLGIWAAMFIAKQQHPAKSVKRISPIQVMRCFYGSIEAVAMKARQSVNLFGELGLALIADESKRTTSKKSRNYPRKKKRKPSGKPKIKAPCKRKRVLAVQFIN